MENELLQELVDKSRTKEELLRKVKLDFDLLPTVLNGLSSSKAAIRYRCAKVLMDLSEEQPERLYPYMDFFIDLLDSKYRILVWNALAIIANLTKVDEDRKLDAMFDKYYRFINDEYMVTVANVVGHCARALIHLEILLCGGICNPHKNNLFHRAFTLIRFCHTMSILSRMRCA